MCRWRRFWLTVTLVAIFLLTLSLWSTSQAQVKGSNSPPETIAQPESRPTPSSDSPTVNPESTDSSLGENTPLEISPDVTSDSPTPPSESTAFPVVLDDKTLFTIQTATSDMYASQRARIASQEISRIAKNYKIPLDTLVVRPNREVFVISQIHTDDRIRFIVAVTRNDAQAAQRPQRTLADDWLKAIQAEIREYRSKNSLKRRIFRVTSTLISTLILILLILGINRLFSGIRGYLNTWQRTQARSIQFQNLEILTVRAQGLLLQHLISLLRWILIITCLFLYSLVISFFFPQTQNLGVAILSFIRKKVVLVTESVVNYLPDLFVIVVVIWIARFLLRANHLIFDALENERITWPGFYPDWAHPTRNLLTLLIWVTTFAIIFPYLPGTTSPAIQGLGILAGALLTVGGAGTVASLISGYVIIFSRAFQEGDLIAFEGNQGFVYQKSVLATQIRSLNGEILTVPNSALQSKTITNYSAIIRDLKLPLALQTTLTLGYDIPWRQIHQVLVEAALDTPEILKDPLPYVLQTSLDDFYVSYKLKVFINKPERIPQIYSNLLQNVQDRCNQAGIEILSPHYRAMRDGNQTTIPADYLPKDYTRPAFRIELPNPPGQPSPPAESE